MKQEGSFFIFLICPTFIFVGLFYFRYQSGGFVSQWQKYPENVITEKPTNILDRNRDRNGRLLTALELALMRQVDKAARTTDDNDFGFRVSKGNNNVRPIVQLRKWHGIPTPVILQWSTQGREGDPDVLLSADCGGCLVTMDRSTVNESVAVVLFHRQHDVLPDPKTRNPKQVYAFRSVETPSKLLPGDYLKDPSVDSIFNLTMNFRRNSDIIFHFANKEKAIRHSKILEERGELQSILNGKNKMAVWFVSNCHALPGSKARMRYVMEMVKAGLKLDKFGKCFSGDGLRRKGNVQRESKDYKFYLAFENSVHCPNYVSEKLWRNSLGAVLVPVIFGPTKQDVEIVAPKNSFIHVDDFDTPADLVKYLEYLDSNNTAYMEYHKWRNENINEKIPEWEVENSEEPAFCRLCRRQVLEDHPPKTVQSIYKWFYETGFVDDECLTPKYKLDKGEEKEFEKFAKSPNAYIQP